MHILHFTDTEPSIATDFIALRISRFHAPVFGKRVIMVLYTSNYRLSIIVLLPSAKNSQLYESIKIDTMTRTMETFSFAANATCRHLLIFLLQRKTSMYMGLVPL